MCIEVIYVNFSMSVKDSKNLLVNHLEHDEDVPLEVMGCKERLCQSKLNVLVSVLQMSW